MSRLRGADATKHLLRGVRSQIVSSAAKRYFVASSLHSRVLQHMVPKSGKLPPMKCLICKQFNVQPRTATLTLERGGMTLVVKHVLARVCPNCGEEYIDEGAATRLLETAEQAFLAGVQVDVREYALTV